MRIGILTYHRAENYGALLQAYALRSFLKSQGHEVGFVDYWPDYHEDYFRIFPRRRFRAGSIASKVACIYMATIWGIPRLRRKRVMKGFMKNYLGLPDNARYKKDSDVCKEFDVVVYGSDQIWRHQNLPGHKGLDLWYFGSSNIVSEKIAYAGSMGPTQLSEDEKEQVKSLLSNFKALSVRETPLKGLLDSLGLESSVVVDPVFLLNREQWMQLAQQSGRQKKDKYILFYNLLNSAEAKSFAEKLSREHKLPIVEISKKYGIRYLGKRYSHTASVPDFLSLLHNAEYVVSNSFHGVAMSIIFGKQFYAVGMGARSGRVESLLTALQIEDRYCVNGNKPSGDIDYEAVGDRIIQYANNSKVFLKKSLENL